MPEQILSLEILLRGGCDIISIPSVTCIISNIWAGGCGCNWSQTSYPEQRCPSPQEAWQLVSGAETPRVPISSLLISCLHDASNPSPRQGVWALCTMPWNHHALNSVRDKLYSSRCAVVQPIYSLPYQWCKAKEAVELAEPVFSRTFIWKVMKVMKTLLSLPDMPGCSALGYPSLGGQLVLCLPSYTRSAAQAVMASWTGERKQLCSPRSAHKMVAGQGSGGSPALCRGQSLGREVTGMAKVYWYYWRAVRGVKILLKT